MAMGHPSQMHGRCIFCCSVPSQDFLRINGNVTLFELLLSGTNSKGKPRNFELLLIQETEPATSVSRDGKSPDDDSGSRASANASSTVFRNSKRILSRAAVGISSMSRRFKSGSKTLEIPALLA